MLGETAAATPTRKSRLVAHAKTGGTGKNNIKGKTDTNLRLASLQAKKAARKEGKTKAELAHTRLAAQTVKAKPSKSVQAQQDSDAALLAVLIAHSQSSGVAAKSSLLARDQSRDNVK